jgi:hypothetical protein
MPWGLTRFQHSGQSHFVTFWPAGPPFFLLTLPRLRLPDLRGVRSPGFRLPIARFFSIEAMLHLGPLDSCFTLISVPLHSRFLAVASRRLGMAVEKIAGTRR